MTSKSTNSHSLLLLTHLNTWKVGKCVRHYLKQLQHAFGCNQQLNPMVTIYVTHNNLLRIEIQINIPVLVGVIKAERTENAIKPSFSQLHFILSNFMCKIILESKQYYFWTTPIHGSIIFHYDAAILLHS